MKVSVIVPTMNEEKGISQVLKKIPSVYEKIVIDKSTDNTAKVAKKAGAIVKRLKQNRGKADALIEGIKLSKKYKPDIVVFIDGDGQHFPEDIPKMIKPIQDREADVVFGCRKTLDKHYSSILPGFAADIIFGCKDILCGYKAMTFDAMNKLQIPNGVKYAIELVLNKELKRNKLSRKYVQIQTTKGTGSNISWSMGIQYFLKYVFGGKN